MRDIFALNADLDIIIVDDNLPDGTGVIVDEMSLKDSHLHVIHRSRKAGLETAYVEGFKFALEKGADLVFEMDVDFSHHPKYIKDFLEASKRADLVIWSRYINGVRVEGWRFLRLLLSKFANMFVSYVMVRPVWDFTAGFRCYRREVLKNIDLDSIHSDGYAFQIEMTYKVFDKGYRVVEIPILFAEREHGYSKISRSVIWEAFWLTLRCRAPLIKIIGHLQFLCHLRTIN